MGEEGVSAKRDTTGQAQAVQEVAKLREYVETVVVWDLIFVMGMIVGQQFIRSNVEDTTAVLLFARGLVDILLGLRLGRATFLMTPPRVTARRADEYFAVNFLLLLIELLVVLTFTGWNNRKLLNAAVVGRLVLRGFCNGIVLQFSNALKEAWVKDQERELQVPEKFQGVPEVQELSKDALEKEVIPDQNEEEMVTEELPSPSKGT